MKPRKLIEQLEGEIKAPEKRIVFLWGARQVGKSTILKHLWQKYGGAFFNFDDLNDQRLFVPELEKLKSSVAAKSSNKDSKLVFIDEVQKFPESTQSLKLLADNSDYMVLATGSSELRAKTNRFDTLAGRYKEFVLFPLTIDELDGFYQEARFVEIPDFAQRINLSRRLEELIIYGSYPGVVESENKIEELKNIAQNSVVKDIVNIYDLKNTDLVFRLLQVLAMQTGNLINVAELASSLGSTKITIDNYLSILMRNRVIFLLEPFKTNKRRGYLERKKVYFVDLGIRNAFIEDFRPVEVRQDLGNLFENLVIAGAYRQNIYRRQNNKLYYFREVAGAQKEIDLILENSLGEKKGFEIKLNGGKANEFTDLGISGYEVITKENAAEFLV